MSDVNHQLVREFFELNMFQALTLWQHNPAIPVAGDPGMLLFVENSRPLIPRTLDLVLQPADLAAIPRAVVDIRAWHRERFYPSVVESSPVLSHFVSDESKRVAAEVFSTDEFVSILVISELPRTPEQRARSIQLLKGAGIDHILEFPTMLQDMFDKLSDQGNYAISPTLQVLRLLKRYRFVRNQQLEFGFQLATPRVDVAPLIETTSDPGAADDDDNDAESEPES